MRSAGFALALVLALSPFSAAAQAGNSPDSIFTITVAAPTSPKDVQVRYFLDGDPGVQQASSIAKIGENKIGINVDQGKWVKGLKAIAYSPSCQLVTLSVDDLASSDRQGEFDCLQLPTVPLQAKVSVSKFGGKDLQVEALYNCRWAGRFFGVPGLAVSPFSLGKAHVDADGSFTFDVPDFANDPSWASFSNDATLTFYLVDAQSGQRLGKLTALGGASRDGALKVQPSYPGQFQFSAQVQRVRSSKNSR